MHDGVGRPAGRRHSHMAAKPVCLSLSRVAMSARRMGATDNVAAILICLEEKAAVAVCLCLLSLDEVGALSLSSN